MILVATTCALLLLFTTLIHYEALRALSVALPKLRIASRAKLIAVIIGAFTAHVAEIVLYAMAMYGLARWLGAGTLGRTTLPGLDMLLYFSAETYTSLGYGDIVPHGPLRMLAGAEALTGLLLIGWSASYVFVAMQRFWKATDRGLREREDERGVGVGVGVGAMVCAKTIERRSGIRALDHGSGVQPKRASHPPPAAANEPQLNLSPPGIAAREIHRHRVPSRARRTTMASPCRNDGGSRSSA
jgi:hypothetical protein